MELAKENETDMTSGTSQEAKLAKQEDMVGTSQDAERLQEQHISGTSQEPHRPTEDNIPGGMTFCSVQMKISYSW